MLKFKKILIITSALMIGGVGIFASFSSLGNGFGRTQSEACNAAKASARSSCQRFLNFIDSCNCSEAWNEPSGSSLRWSCNISASCADQAGGGSKNF